MNAKFSFNPKEDIMTQERFSGSNAALLLVDHQTGTMGWARSIPFEVMKTNAIMLAKSATIMKMPIVLTSSMEDFIQGPLLAEFAEICPEAFANRVKRMGIVNAMEDEGFAAAVKATGRKKIVIAGVTNDVCTVFPVLTLLDQGYDVQVVADAGGSPTEMADRAALDRMSKAGATIVSANMVIAELAGDWGTEEGGQVVQLIVGALMS
jgi:nicotinamidase-related amidase